MAKIWTDGLILYDNHDSHIKICDSITYALFVAMLSAVAVSSRSPTRDTT